MTTEFDYLAKLGIPGALQDKQAAYWGQTGEWSPVSAKTDAATGGVSLVAGGSPIKAGNQISKTNPAETVANSLFTLPPVPFLESDWQLSLTGRTIGGGTTNVSLFDAKMLPNGNILYCVGRDSTATPTTGVCELNPVTGEEVFNWHDSTWANGAAWGPESAWKYSNGNYLIANVDGGAGTTGRVYEMRPDHSVVWSFNHPDGGNGNCILPAIVNGEESVILFGYGIPAESKIVTIRRSDQAITSTIQITGANGGSDVTPANNYVNNGDFRNIGGVNYLLVSLWKTSTPQVLLLNYDTGALVRVLPISETAGYGPMDAKFVDDNVCMIAEGTSAKITLVNINTASVIYSFSTGANRTMCVSPMKNGCQVVWCSNNQIIYGSTLYAPGVSKYLEATAVGQYKTNAALTLTKFSNKTSDNDAQNGCLILGGVASNRAVIDYDGKSSGTLYIDNSYNNNAGNIDLRVRTAGTAKTPFRVNGIGYPIVKPLEAVSEGTAIGVGMQFSTTSNLGIYFGTGTPSFAAGKGSIYSQTNATTTTTRLWVNTDGSTGWASLTTSA